MSESENVVYYEDMEPVTDVYLQPASDFSDFQYEAGRYKMLSTDGTWDGGLLETLCVWNREAFENAMDAGMLEFTVTGSYVPPDPESGFWDEETHRLWNEGKIQIKGGVTLCVNVHIRPDDYVAVYSPDPDMQIQTIWVDRNQPTDFSQLYLMSYDSLIQDESPYDTPWLEFEILWDEQSYIDGLDSMADQFEIIGNYGDLWSGEPWQEELYAKGLIRTEGHTKTIIRVRDSGEQVYVNPYNDRIGYVWPYEFQIYIRPGTTCEAAVFPAAGSLEPENGDMEQIRDFGLEWSRSEYDAGIASGEDSFVISGKYGLNPEWSQEDQERFDHGTIKIAESTPSPKLTVNILDEELPFSVVMQSRDGLIPVFKFPWPNGALKVTWAFSFDKENWYQEDIWWSSEYDNNLAVGIAAVYDANDQLIAIPEDDPFPFYCKLIVTGSLFEGETKLMKVTPDADGNWNMDEDQGGDHGGGGQGEHDRPGKEEPGESSGDFPGSTPETPPSDKPNHPPAAPSDDASLSIKDRPTQQVQKLPDAPSAAPAAANPSDNASGTEKILDEALRDSIESESDSAGDRSTPETKSNTTNKQENINAGTDPSPAAKSKTQSIFSQIIKYIIAAAATILLIILGAAFTWLYQKKKK